MTQSRQSGAGAPTIVIADDEALIRMDAAAAFLAAGFVVLEAGHAADVLAMMADQASDVMVLLTDVRMPGTMNGVELARHVRVHWPWISLIIASGDARPSAEQLPDGSRFLPKPYEPDHAIRHAREMIALAA